MIQLTPYLDMFMLALMCPCYRSENIAVGKPTAQSSVYNNATSSRAVDGNRNSVFAADSCTHTIGGTSAWWEVNLLNVYTINHIVIYNRNNNQERIDSLYVEGFLVDPFTCTNGQLCTFHPGPSGDVVNLSCSQEVRAKYIRLSKFTTSSLTLCEVEIFGQIEAVQAQLFPQACSQKTMEVMTGKMLTSAVVDLGDATDTVDCLYRCLRRPYCTIINFNNVTGVCKTSESTSLISNDDIISTENWNLCVLC